MAGTALLVALSVPASAAYGQVPPSPVPASHVDENAAIVKPLGEIGRVRARTPYCGALGRARAGIDSAITFQYSTPILANDLRGFRLDSYLTKERSLKKTERDLTALWNLAVAGRDDVRALRTAANADGVDEEKRKEMLAFANALDGAKARQMQLAKSIARVYAVLAEMPIRDIVNTAADDQGAKALAPRAAMQRPQASDDASGAPARTTTTADAIADHTQSADLFGAFAAETFIRDDLKDAALHGNKAMQLGGCAGI